MHLGETRSEESESEESKNEESESEKSDESEEIARVRRVTRVTTFCRNEIKDRNYKSVHSIFSFPFLFQEKKWLPRHAQCHFSLEIFHSPP